MIKRTTYFREMSLLYRLFLHLINNFETASEVTVADYSSRATCRPLHLPSRLFVLLNRREPVIIWRSERVTEDHPSVRWLLTPQLLLEHELILVSLFPLLAARFHRGTDGAIFRFID